MHMMRLCELRSSRWRIRFRGRGLLACFWCLCERVHARPAFAGKRHRATHRLVVRPCPDLPRPAALASVSAGGLGFRAARTTSEQGTKANDAESTAPRSRPVFVPEHHQVRLCLRRLAEFRECLQMLGECVPNRALRLTSCIGSRVDARQARHPGAERAVRFPFDHNWKVLCHSPASARRRRISSPHVMRITD